MENKKDKIKEPYPPEQTPNPPQVIDPNRRNEEGEREAPVENKQGSRNDPRNEGEQVGRKPDNEENEKKEKLLGESETEIDDETTI